MSMPEMEPVTTESEVLKRLLDLSEDEVIVPLKMKREDVNRTKAVKLTDDEVERVEALQEYLFTNKYIPHNTFADLFVYLFNLGFTLISKTANKWADSEEV